MTLTLPPTDLLRERRIELGLPPDLPRPPEARRLLLIGAAIGGGLVALALLVALVLKVQQQLLAAELQRLAPVRGQVQQLEQQMAQTNASMGRVRKGNETLAKGLVAVRSGSALMTDLVDRTPQNLQLTAVKVNKTDLQVKGRTADPGAFERINAMALRLKQSPMIAPEKVSLTRAVRDDKAAGSTKDAPAGGFVDFELTAGFRETLTSAEQLALLQRLGSRGMSQRLQLLQREGLLR
jgi:type IV pilus assembly protein PilN